MLMSLLIGPAFVLVLLKRNTLLLPIYIDTLLLGLRPFKFEAVWMTSSEFGDLMKNEWGRELSLRKALKELSVKLRTWNTATFGNIFKRKRRNELRLGVCRRP